MGIDYAIHSAICVTVISSPVQDQCPRQAVRNYSHLADLTLPHDCKGEAQVDTFFQFQDREFNLPNRREGEIVRKQLPGNPGN